MAPLKKFSAAVLLKFCEFSLISETLTDSNLGCYVCLMSLSKEVSRLGGELEAGCFWKQPVTDFSS